jgi:acetoin utilization deacetylase AcuC-like enzyme
VICFWDKRQQLHAPEGEFFNGAMHSAAESPERVAAILEVIGGAQAPVDQGLAPILEVHDAGYVDFLKTAHSDWLAAGRTGDAFPYTFPLVGRSIRKWDRIDATIGNYSFDTSTPIGPDTWEASYWSAQTAIAAMDALIGGRGVSFGVCRPPGHHAGRDYCGGYCYLNNAAIAAQRALGAGIRRIAILDVDYHHGNGTQDIFKGRSEVIFASIHADPKTDYPFYWGHADESAGNILNLPLPRGTAWNNYAPRLDDALRWIKQGNPELLIVSFGADTHEADPISRFELKTSDYTAMGRGIASLAIPTAILMEGGYAIGALGSNVAEFLSAFQSR